MANLGTNMHMWNYYNQNNDATDDFFFTFKKNRFTTRFQKYFFRRKSLRFHEDFVVCVFLVIVICYRFRFLHPIHICDIFGCSAAEAEEFISKLVKRNYLKLDYVEGIGFGMTIGGHGYYLYSISDSAKEEFLRGCPYYESGIRVRKTISTKLIHDLIALRMSLITATITQAVDLVPDFSSGLSYELDDKIPDVFLRGIGSKTIWVEMEYTTKSGRELYSFCRRTISSIEKKRTDEVFIFLDTATDAIRYRKYFDEESGGTSSNLFPQIHIIQSKSISFVDAFGGEVPDYDTHRIKNYRKGHIPHALQEKFHRYGRGNPEHSSQSSAYHFSCY
jgi:hypothetical protein